MPHVQTHTATAPCGLVPIGQMHGSRRMADAWNLSQPRMECLIALMFAPLQSSSAYLRAGIMRRLKKGRVSAHLLDMLCVMHGPEGCTGQPPTPATQIGAPAPQPIPTAWQALIHQYQRPVSCTPSHSLTALTLSATARTLALASSLLDNANLYLLELIPHFFALSSAQTCLFTTCSY